MKNISTTIGVIIIVVVVIVLCGGVFAWQYFAKLSQTPNQTPEQISDTTDSLGQDQLSTANWTTYTSGHGYKIKFPQNWVMDYDASGFGNNGDGSVVFCPPESQGDKTNVLTGEKGNCIVNETKGVSIDSKTPIILRRCSLQANDELRDCMQSSDTVKLFSNSNYSYNLFVVDPKYKTAYSQMLSTFEFTNQSGAPIEEQTSEQHQQPIGNIYLRYSIGEYGVRFDYLASYKVKLLGPNQEQKLAFPYYQYNGIKSSYESAIIYYSDDSYFEVGRVDVMPSYNKELSVANYNDDPNLYENSLCDPLVTRFKKEGVGIEYIDGIKMLRASGYRDGVSMICYYFKHTSNKLIVITISNHKLDEVFSNIAIAPEVPLSKDEIAKKYNERYSANVHWAQLTKKGNEDEPVTLSQAVLTPSKAFETAFDYVFPQKNSDATLIITLDSVPIATIKSKDYLWASLPVRFRVITDDPSLLGKKDKVLGFNLYGSDGVQVELTNITMQEYNGL